MLTISPSKRVMNGESTPVMKDKVERQLELMTSVNDLLMSHLEKELDRISIHPEMNAEDKIKNCSDLIWIVSTGILNRLTSRHSMTELARMITRKGFERTRIDFILKATSLLRLHLTDEGYDTLLNTVYRSLCLYDDSQFSVHDEEVFILNESNVVALTPSLRMLKANYYLVPLILYSYLPVEETVSMRIMELDRLASEQINKLKGRRR